jgi:hypothetical protein
MSWGNKTTATQLTSITTEQFFSFGGSSYVYLNPGESAHVQVKYNPVGSPTDHLIVAVYGTLDASTQTSDVTPFMEFTVDKASDPNYVSFIVSGLYGFRIGVRRSGTTDTITDADCAYRLDGVTL